MMNYITYLISRQNALAIPHPYQSLRDTKSRRNSKNHLPIFTYKIIAIASDHCINSDTIN